MGDLSYTKCISCLLLFISQSLFADNFKLPQATTCALDVPQQQRAPLLNQCLTAANSGDKEAQYQLGLYYSDGLLTPPNYPLAISWFKKASLQAHLGAQVKLGYMYFKGQGTPINNLQAYIIFKIAGINGSDEAMDVADQVASHMTAQELQKANIILGKTFKAYLQQEQNNQ